jgi:pimeloyl-ACP methyl ester carboxylesterase
MFSRRLPHLLSEVRTPSLVVWGESDAVIPGIVGQQYAEGLANSTLETVAAAGHIVEWDQPEDLAELITNHSG